jgi:hypothetical protein
MASPPHPNPLPRWGRGSDIATWSRVNASGRQVMVLGIMILSMLFAVTPLRAADETNSSSGLDYNSFDLISKRNIFNPNRRPGRSIGPRLPAVQIDSFTLIGTMSYEKGRFAFFDGTSSEYRKPLKPSDTIAGYRISEITQSGVTLLASSNKVINLPVGTQMKRQDNGPWELMSHAEPIASTNPGEPADLATKAANLNGAESDALKRLMMRRLKEQ